jgi:DNA-binding NarL/FixJ family response regulator
MPNKAPSASSSQHRKLSVLVVDQHPVVRDSIVTRLDGETDFSVCGQVSSGFEAQKALQRSRPDFLLTELALPDRHGLEFIKDIRAEYASLQILVFTTEDENTFALRALRAGASGYVMKWEPLEHLLDAMRLVAAGNYAVNPEIWARFLQNPRREDADSGDTTMFTRLTDRELEVFELIGKGAATREIAAHLNRSVSVVEACRLSIKEKLHLRDCSDLVCRAIRWIEIRNRTASPAAACNPSVVI